MNDKIKQALEKLFFDKGYRIVFWYDRDQDLRADYEALQLDRVEKIELHHNEFAVKYRLLHEQPDTKFLLYHEGAPPADIDNWLLDIQLAHTEFSTDQISIWLSEIELSPEYADVVKAHEEFFKAQPRREQLKALVSQADTDDTVRLKMLAVCTRSETRIDSILETLLEDEAQDSDDKISLIERCNLSSFLWKRVNEDYGYQSDTVGIKDFAIELFKSCYAMGVDGDVKLRSEALVFFKRWKDSRSHSASFTTLSNRYADLLAIESDLLSRELDQLVALDYFWLIDLRIIAELRDRIKERTITTRECEDIIRQRRTGFWYSQFEHIYQAVDYGSRFITALDEIDLSMGSLLDGFERYTSRWFKVDQFYRKYSYHARVSHQATLFNDLTKNIDELYVNKFLYTLNNRWQEYVNDMDRWSIPTIKPQSNFYFEYIEPFVTSKARKKIYVIISDALRYEIGDEFVSRIRSEDRYDAELDALLTTLPNYTQLGMAALLPHDRLIIDPDKGKDTVYINDKQSTQGKDSRAKILSQVNGTAIKAEDVMSMSSHQVREEVKPYDVVYVYHNQIDNTGDDLTSQAQTFEAVEETLTYLIDLIKKLTNANANNIIITADHGFLFQNRKLEDSDYIDKKPVGQLFADTRRFVMGQSLQENASFKHFTAEQLGIQGDFDVQIPKSINRLRQSGSGSQYVHGGASLQEIIIPVIRINKKRNSDVRKVNVSIVRGTNSVISTNQLTFKLYQEEPVTAKVHPRTLTIGLYTKEGQLISDSHERTFDMTVPNEREREREQPITLGLSKEADSVNNQLVYVRLMEQESGTSHQMEYRSTEYRLRISFKGDFDMF